MPQREIDSPSSDGAKLVASLLARIDGLIAQIAARAERGGPPKTPDNSSLPPSRGQKANGEPPAVKQRRKGRPGVARKLDENPDATQPLFAWDCPRRGGPRAG